MAPFDQIEEATKRANTVRRDLFLLSLVQVDPELKARYEDAAAEVEALSNELYDTWNRLLNINMRNWEARADVALGEFVTANAQIKRATTDLAKAGDDVVRIARVVANVAKVVAIVAKIALI